MNDSERHPSKNLAKRIRSLQSKKGRREYGTFLAEGPHVVREAIRARYRIRTLLYSESYRESFTVDRPAGTVEAAEVFILPDSDFEKISPTKSPQGILAEVELPSHPQFPEDPPLEGTIVILDEIQDPGNVGTAIRSAAGLGGERVLLTPGCADIWNPKTVRASAGATFHLPVHPNLEIHEIGNWLASIDATLWVAIAEGQSIHSVAPPSGPLAVVFGNETKGPDPSWKDLPSATTVGLPMDRMMDSLNVGVASAVFLGLVREKNLRTRSDTL